MNKEINRMLLIWIVVAVLCLCAIVAITYARHNFVEEVADTNKEQTEEVDSKLSELQTSYDALQSSVDEQLEVISELQDEIEELSGKLEELNKQNEEVAEQGDSTPQLSPTAGLVESDYEYHVTCAIVMGEAGGESTRGQQLIAQSILDGCILEGMTPSELRVAYSYQGWNENYTQEVMDAVDYIFVEGNRVTEEPTLYMYNPAMCISSWHESQNFVTQEGNVRFFN